MLFGLEKILTFSKMVDGVLQARAGVCAAAERRRRRGFGPRRRAEQFIGGANGVNVVFLKFEFSENDSKKLMKRWESKMLITFNLIALSVQSLTPL